MALTQASFSGGAAVAVSYPGYVNARSLAANTAETITIPAGARYVAFAASSATDPFYVAYSGTAAIPADVDDGTAIEMNPQGMRVIAGLTSLSIISPAAIIVTASFWS